MNLDDTQAEVELWVRRCFGIGQATNPRVRALRHLEEAIEFAQSVGVEAGKCRELIDYVYARPAGDPSQELGGIGITLLAAAGALGVFASEVIEAEKSRILSKSPEHFTARNQVKCDAGFR